MTDQNPPEVLDEKLPRGLMSQHFGTILLFLSLFWCMLGLRFLARLGFSWPGLLEDLAITLFFTLLFVLGRLVPRMGSILMLLGVLGVQGLSFSFVIYYRFFHAFPSVSTFSGIGLLGAASSSLAPLIQRQDLLLIPAFLLALLVLFTPLPERRKLSKFSLGMMLVAFVSFVGARYSQSQGFIRSQHNPFVYLVNSPWQAEAMPAQIAAAESKDSLTSVEDAIAQLNSSYQASYRANDPKFPLYRVPRKPMFKARNPKNVVVIFLESYRSLEGGISGVSPDKAPVQVVGTEINKLAQSGWFFPHFYANAHQTTRAELAMLCSMYPPTMTHSAVYSGSPNLQVRCLPDVLSQFGYYTAWMSSFDGDYGNKRNFLTGHGIQHVIDGWAMADWPHKEPQIGWGASDLDFFDFSLTQLKKMPEPFFVELMTLSNHHPFEENYNIPQDHIPINQDNPIYGRYKRGLHFTDYAVGRFMKEAKKQPWFENTVFVFMGDHGIWTFPEDSNYSDVYKTEIFHRTGLVLWGPQLQAKRFDNIVGSQVDFAPTMLDLLGIKAPQAFMGTSLIDKTIKPEDRYALTRNETTWNIRKGNQYCYSSGHSCFIDQFPYCREGENPKETGFSCFKADGDLIAAPKEAVALETQDENNLLSFGFHILKLNQNLLRGDSFAPLPCTKDKMDSKNCK